MLVIAEKNKSAILMFVKPEDMSYLQYYRPFLKNRPTYFIEKNPQTFSEMEIYAKSKNIRQFIVTNKDVLNKIVVAERTQSLDDWQGSLYERSGITTLFLNPLGQIFSVPYGKYIAEHFTNKLVNPGNWPRTPEFSYEVLTGETATDRYNLFQRALAIAVDIETVSFEDRQGEYQTIIRCICYSGLFEDGEIYTIVIPISEAKLEEQEYYVTWMRKFNNLSIPKIFQNGLYDTGHLLSYGSPVSQYYFDTQSLFHSWYSELPKRLDFISAFSVHNIFYWKDMGKLGGLSNLYEYNARDGWATLCSFLYLIQAMPDWAITNYLLKFPLWVPCCYCNLEGCKIDENTRNKLIEEYKSSFETTLSRLRSVLGQQFNPNSSQQVTKLIQFYGSFDITNADDDALDKFALRHPLNARFAGQIKTVRKTSKIISTYLKPSDYSTAVKSTKKKSYLLKGGRLLYALNPDGTDTGRLSCKESIFWTGSQVQNQPSLTKKMWVPDEGFEMFELDNTTSESYCAGNSSGDPNLLDTLNSGKDFHATNAERFFGIPYDKIVIIKDGIKEIIDKDLRNLSKRTNHGATYNMGWFVLLTTMGEENVDKAKKLLNLNPLWTRRRVCEYLIESYEKAYPTVKTDWYEAIVNIVTTVHLLTSPLGWSRYCFGEPKKSNHQKNSYIAHVPQNMSVGIINESFKDIFWKIAVPNNKNFRLKAQVHDSILGQNRIGFRHLVYEAQKLCVRPTKVRDLVKGYERIMTIPVEGKIGPNWYDMKVMEIPK